MTYYVILCYIMVYNNTLESDKILKFSFHSQKSLLSKINGKPLYDARIIHIEYDSQMEACMMVNSSIKKKSEIEIQKIAKEKV